MQFYLFRMFRQFLAGNIWLKMAVWVLRPLLPAKDLLKLVLSEVPAVWIGSGTGQQQFFRLLAKLLYLQPMLPRY